MEWTDIISTAVSTISGGGVVGVAGGLISSWFKSRQQKQEIEEKRSDQEFELKKIKLQSELKVGEETELTKVKSDADTQSKSYEALKESVGGNVTSFVAAARSLFRLVLTTGLVILVYMIFTDLLAAMKLSESSLLAKAFKPAEMGDLIKYIVNTIVFCTSTAVTWWFAERGFMPPGMKHR